MYRKTFYLKQHTPIIHFQHDQAGATLRATEVKPKLDRFLILALGNGNRGNGLEAAANENWLVGKSEALDYKITFSSKGNSSYYLPLSLGFNNDKSALVTDEITPSLGSDFDFLAPSPFFANEDKIKWQNRPLQISRRDSKLSEIRFGLLAPNEIKGVVTSIKEDLLRFVQSRLVGFFLWENFGTRQSKGFGSFTVTALGGSRVNDDDLLRNMYLGNTRVNGGVSAVFALIKKDFTLLKSGINHRRYEKSKLFQVFARNGIRWEKRKLKQEIDRINGTGRLELFTGKNIAPVNWNDRENGYENYWDDPENANYEYKFIRALLGFTDKYEFQIFSKAREGRNWMKRTNRRGEYFPDFGNPIVTSVSHIPDGPNQRQIARFKSPVRFKVVNNRVYVGADKTYESILGKNFRFVFPFRDQGNDPHYLDLRVPNAFDLENFLTANLPNHWTRT